MNIQDYKVLLVDDERIIREGIGAMIKWSELGLQYVGDAKDGVEAFEKINIMKPDIIITDIQMPKMNGLELIKKAREKYGENIEFVVLSAHDNFEFAKTAMYHGVKHYVVKPCDELDITKTLNKVKFKLDESRKKDKTLKIIQRELKETTPMAMEQYFRGILLEHTSMNEKSSLLDIGNKKMRIVLFQLNKRLPHFKLHELKSITIETLGTLIIITTIIDGYYLILVNDIEIKEIRKLIEMIIARFKNSFDDEKVLTIISEQGNFYKLPSLYKEVTEYLNLGFYFEQEIIIANDVKKELNELSNDNILPDFDNIILATKAGNKDYLKKEIQLFFSLLGRMQSEIGITLGYCTDLLVSLAKEASPNTLTINKVLAPLFQIKTLNEISLYVEKVALKIANQHHSSKYHSLIQDMLGIIHENLEKKELSIRWIAKNLLYVNADYLGKLFRKEMNEGFTQYVTRVRIDKAKQLIIEKENHKVYQIAEDIGFGNNSQYFYQVFKKHTGLTPLEFKSVFKQKDY